MLWFGLISVEWNHLRQFHTKHDRTNGKSTYRTIYFFERFDLGYTRKLENMLTKDYWSMRVSLKWKQISIYFEILWSKFNGRAILKASEQIYILTTSGFVLTLLMRWPQLWSCLCLMSCWFYCPVLERQLVTCPQFKTWQEKNCWSFKSSIIPILNTKLFTCSCFSTEFKYVDTVKWNYTKHIVVTWRSSLYVICLLRPKSLTCKH